MRQFLIVLGAILAIIALPVGMAAGDPNIGAILLGFGFISFIVGRIMKEVQ